MIGDMGRLEVMNSNNPELRWKPVKKGRSSRKSSSRCLNGFPKFGNFGSPKSFGEFSGSDSDKCGEGLLGQSSSSKLESVPIKKRRHLLCKDFITQCSFPSLEEDVQISYPRFSSDDFSGIELLAAAASMDEDSDNCGKEILGVEDLSAKQKSLDASCAPLSPKICLKSNESKNFSSNMTAKGGNAHSSVISNDSGCASQRLCGSTETGIVPKALSRKHWDLNILMDAWEEPHDSVGGSKEFNGDINTEKGKNKNSDYVALSAGGGKSTEPSDLNLNENNSAVASPDKACINTFWMEEHIGSQSVTAATEGDETTGGEFQGMTEDGNLSSDSLGESEHHAMRKDNDLSISSEPCCTSSIFECVCKRTGTSGQVNSATQTGVVREMLEPADLQCQDFKKTNGPLLSIEDLKDQNQVCSTVGSADAEIQDHFPDNESKNYTLEESKSGVDGSSKSIDDGALEDLRFSRVDDFAKTTLEGSNMFKAQILVDGDTYAASEEDHDSPYEDGELRGSFMYSWEENECVDYESDGRKEDDTPIDDCHVSELADDSSEVSHCLERRNMLPDSYLKAGENKSGPLETSVMKDIVADDSNNDSIMEKGSNAGSGSTIDRSSETIGEFGDSRNDVDVKMVVTDHASRVSRGKLNDSAFTQHFRSRRYGNSYSHIERGIRPEKPAGRQRSPCVRERAQWTSWTSRMRNYQLPESNPPSNPRNIRNVSVERIGSRPELLESRQTDNDIARRLRRPLLRRSSMERAEYAGDRRRVPLARGCGNFRSRGGQYLHQAERSFEDFGHLRNDSGPPPVRFPHSSSRSSHMHFPRRRSRSRSRSHSPRMWHPRREHLMSGRQNRSPDYRTEGRVDRVRVPFPKPSFAASYDEGYESTSRGNYKFADDYDYPENHSKRRRSPVRVLRHPRRFGDQMEPNEYYRPGFHTGRFPLVASGKGRKVESDFVNRRRDGAPRMMH